MFLLKSFISLNQKSLSSEEIQKLWFEDLDSVHVSPPDFLSNLIKDYDDSHFLDYRTYLRQRILIVKSEKCVESAKTKKAIYLFFEQNLQKYSKSMTLSFSDFVLEVCNKEAEEFQKCLIILDDYLNFLLTNGNFIRNIHNASVAAAIYIAGIGEGIATDVEYKLLIGQERISLDSNFRMESPVNKTDVRIMVKR